MIRDEFKNADKKAIEKKANKKMKEMGERAYYAKKISTINELFKPVKFSTIFCTICFSLLSALYILSYSLAPTETKFDFWNWIVLGLTAALLIWTVVWFAFLVPYFHKKSAFYKSELDKLNREYVLNHTRR